MLHTVSDDVLRAIMAAIDDSVVNYAILPQVCQSLRSTIRSNPPATLILPGDLPWATMATSPTRQDALLPWFTDHMSNLQTLIIHVAASSNGDGVTLHPAHRTLTPHTVCNSTRQ